MNLRGNYEDRRIFMLYDNLLHNHSANGNYMGYMNCPYMDEVIGGMFCRYYNTFIGDEGDTEFEACESCEFREGDEYSWMRSRFERQL